MHVLFVCTANINRSFMAEVIFAERRRRHGKQGITVSSAALVDMKGAPADSVAVRVLQENGFEGTDHHSRLLTEEMVAEAGIITAMEEAQRKTIAERYPEAEAKLRLLKSFTKGYRGIDTDIRDPYRMPLYYYRLCFSEIFLAVEGMLGAI